MGRRAVKRRTTLLVAVVAAAVASVVSVSMTLLVVRLTDSSDSSDSSDDAVGAVAQPAAAGVSAVAARSGGRDAGLDLAGLFARVGSGVLRVETTACVRGGAGSGFLVGPDLVLTAAHVVDGAHTIILRRDDGTDVEGGVVGIDTVHDVALVRTARAVDGHVFRFAAGVPAVGAEVAAVGYPVSGGLVPVRRTVTGLDQRLDVSAAGTAGAQTVVEGLLRVDGGFEAGASGGPVLTGAGDVVGVVEGRSRDDRTVGYAVGADHAAPLVAQWRGLRSTVDVGDSCAVPVGPPQSRVVVRDETRTAPGRVVADLLGSYASAVNSARYDDAWSMLTERARGGRTVAQWSDGERAALIFDAVVRQVDVAAAGADPTTAVPPPSIAPARPGGAAGTTGTAATTGVPVPGEGGRLRAVVELSQAREDGRAAGGDACSRWRFTYVLTRTDGQWRIDGSTPAAGFPQSC